MKKRMDDILFFAYCLQYKGFAESLECIITTGQIFFTVIKLHRNIIRGL